MSEVVVGRAAASRYVGALFGSAPEGVLVEVRFRVASGMRQGFFTVGASRAVVDAVAALATRTDVFVGVLPRVRRRGRVEDVVERGWVVWVDCDTSASAAALRSFEPRPSMVVASGSGQHRHAYWFLEESVDLAWLERLNRRLALALGADAGVVTKPHTILRPPGSLNWKHRPPAPVRLLGLCEQRRVSAVELDRQLPLERERIERAARAPGQGLLSARVVDSLAMVPPRVYFERLTGARVGRSGNVCCPFHEDRSPSLHVYDDPSRGWYCFGCGRGGSIYDLASLVWLSGQSSGVNLRGRRFVEVRDRLASIFLAGPQAAGSSGQVIDGSRARLQPLGEARPSAER